MLEDLEKNLWSTADKLRANMDAADTSIRCWLTRLV
jgi:hypothetical protein